jgi:hypothetical protein
MTVLKYNTTDNRSVCSVQAFVMDSVRNDPDDPTTQIADSIRTSVCNGSIFFMRQNFNGKLLPHSTPFITSYFPTKANNVHKEDKYNYYNHTPRTTLRTKGDEILDNEKNLGERIIGRCQIKKLRPDQYYSLNAGMITPLIININFDIESNNNIVFDYDRYIEDSDLRTKIEIGGGGRKNKRTQRKIKRTTMRKYKLKGKKKIVHTFRKN